MKRYKILIIFAAVLSLMMNIVKPVLTFGSDDGGMEDGIYTLPVALWNASADEASMGNNALMQTGKLVVENGKYILYLKFSNMTFSGMTGYLSAMDLLENITYNSFHYPESYQLVPGTVVSTYSVVDEFNGPDSTDVNCAGKKYPKVISIPVSLEEDNIWTHVYVPIMGSLGFGNQICRIHLDRNNITPITEEEKAAWEEYESNEEQTENTTSAGNTENKADKTKLYEQIVKATGLLGQTDKYTEASLSNLKTALENAQKAYDSDTNQTVVNGQQAALEKAIEELVEKSDEKLDKDNLRDGKYYVYIYLWKATANQASMGDPALNHKALLTVKDGVYQIDLSTKTMTVGTITACLQSLQVKQPDGSYVYADITARNNPENQPSIFQFTLPSKDEYIDVLIDPKVEVMGKDPLPARLKIHWDTLKKASDDAEVKEKIKTTKSKSKKTESETTTPAVKIFTKSTTRKQSTPTIYSEEEASIENTEDITEHSIEESNGTEIEEEIHQQGQTPIEEVPLHDNLQPILAIVMVGGSVFVSGILAAVTMIVMFGRRRKVERNHE